MTQLLKQGGARQDSLPSPRTSPKYLIPDAAGARMRGGIYRTWTWAPLRQQPPRLTRARHAASPPPCSSSSMLARARKQGSLHNPAAGASPVGRRRERAKAKLWRRDAREARLPRPSCHRRPSTEGNTRHADRSELVTREWRLVARDRRARRPPMPLLQVVSGAPHRIGGYHTFQRLEKCVCVSMCFASEKADVR